MLHTMSVCLYDGITHTKCIYEYSHNGNNDTIFKLNVFMNVDIINNAI